MTPPLSIPSFILLSVACIVANCLQPAAGLALIKHLTQEKPSFCRMKAVMSFIGAAIIAPSLSATLGVTTLWAIEVLPSTSYGISWLTWWLASVLAMLVFTPPLLLWREDTSPTGIKYWIEMVVVLISALSLSWLTFVYGYPIEYALLVVLIWAVFRLGNFTASVLVSLIATIAIITTSRGLGSFATDSTPESLVLLQSFIAVCSIATLVLGAVLRERKVAEATLECALLATEQKVADRTAELQASKAILDGFFSTAPVGMGIVDHDLRYVRVNALLAEMNGTPIAQHPGRTVRDILPSLAPSIEPVYNQVLTTGQPILNREESAILPNHPDEKRTWLASYFPILHSAQMPPQVGVILMEISEIKQLEMQLRQQAYLDGLTRIANRQYFNEIFEVEWRRCARSQKPLSIVLIDIDDFKAYNDTYGHLVGDDCLKRFATMLMQAINRSSDLVARFGGEEFVVLLPETNPQGALHIAHSIQHLTHRLQIPHQRSSVSPYLTASIGVATCIPTTNRPLNELLQVADKALYESKRQGRDRVTTMIVN